MKIYKYYINTFIMAGGATVAACLVGGLAGYSISKLKPKGTGIIFMVLFWIMLMPGTLRTVPLYIGFKDVPLFHISLLDTFWPIWIMSASSIFNIILFKNFFDGISGSIIEAAKIDGANDYYILFKIMMPLAKPIIAVITLYYAVSLWNNYFTALIYLDNRALFPLQLVLREILIQNDTASVSASQAGAVQAYADNVKYATIVVSTIPILCVYPFIQRYFVKGVMIGAVKE